jgi:hypothetical protein
VLIGRRKRSMSVSFSRNPNRYVRTVGLSIPAKESRRFVSSPLPLPETPESVERPEFTKKSKIHLLRKSKTIPPKKWIYNHSFLLTIHFATWQNGDAAKFGYLKDETGK